MKQSKYKLVYKTQTTPFFPICLAAKNYTRNLKKLIGFNLFLTAPIIAVIYNDITHWFFSQENSKPTTKFFDKFLSNNKYLQNIKNKENQSAKKLFRAIKTPITDLFDEKKLNKRGENKLKTLFKNIEDYFYFIDIPGFLFQLYYVPTFKKEIFTNLKIGRVKKEEIFNLILSSYQKTNYEKFLVELYNHILSQKSKENLVRISKDYYWLVHDYLGEIIDLTYLQNQINTLKKKSVKELKKELEEVETRIKNITKAKKLFPEKLQRKINIIQEILYLYNERKKVVMNKVNVYIRQIVQYKFSRKSLEEIHRIYQLMPEEVIKFLADKKIERFEGRHRNWVYELKDNRIKTGNKKYLDLVIVSKDIKILKGFIASPGKITGEVDLILNISHIQKFKEGHILVAPFTNVNYLPIMRKAKAILTEVGGMTSHAAIVSRELKKPCIVGIKNLISILKDGDLVEVDANKGRIKILKKI